MMLRTKSEQLKKSQGLPAFAPGPLPLALSLQIGNLIVAQAGYPLLDVCNY